MSVSIIMRHRQSRPCQNDSGKSANPVTARDTIAQPESATSAMVEDTSAHHFQKERLSPGTSASDAKEAGTCPPVQGTSESRSVEPNQSLPPAQDAEGQGATINIPHVTDHSWSQLLSQGVCEKEQEENGRRVGTFEWINIPHTFEGVGLKASMDNPYRTIPLHTDQPKGTNVNHPDHYNAGGIECIDAMEAAATPEEFRGFCKLNALKYLWRERGKNGNEDLEKAAWYLNRAIESSKREKAV